MGTGLLCPTQIRGADVSGEHLSEKACGRTARSAPCRGVGRREDNWYGRGMPWHIRGAEALAGTRGKLKCPLPSGQLALPEKDAVVPIVLKGLGGNFRAAETKETNSPGTRHRETTILCRGYYSILVPRDHHSPTHTAGNLKVCHPTRNQQ